jgi:lysylphosphatidylglycerol synthetase-like protein (DUF2156 family)
VTEKYLRRRYVLIWQALLLILGTSWLWAPHLNLFLNYRTSLISQYETPGEPFAWLFRLGDAAAGLLILSAAWYLSGRRSARTAVWLLAAIGVGILLDPILTTTCRPVGTTCQEYVSFSFVLHAIETVFTSSAFFIIAIYDYWRRKKLVSLLFILFQFVYGLMFVSQLASQENFNTVSQYVYQITLLVWLAWYVRDLTVSYDYQTERKEKLLTRNLTAVWAFVNGVLAILISLAHINLLGRINGLYFTGDSAWLAQHGVIIGVVMIYLARHLARGETRARQIFLTLAGIETVKYSVVSPHAGLMMFYMLTFVALFLFRDDFDRGSIPLTWGARIRDLYFMVGGLVAAAFTALVALDRDNRASVITLRAADNFTDYVTRGHELPHKHINSILLAHTASVFITAGLAAVLWILFRPRKIATGVRADYQAAGNLLSKYSDSSEDFFKLWPRDKRYFWSKHKSGFVGYKLEGPVAFALADPIAPKRKDVILAFNAWCRRRGLKVCWLPVYETGRDLYEKSGLSLLQIGSSAIIDIQTYINETSRDKWWRWRLNKSRKSGYEYSVSPPPHNKTFLADLRKVSDAWLAAGRHKERGFALGYFDKAYLQKCKIHYLKDSDGRIIAFTNEVPRYGKVRTATIDLLRYYPETDSMAFLLYSVIENIGKDQAIKHFDLGFVPFTGASGPLQAIAKSVSADRFSAKGLEQFKNKFDPVWEPNYLAYDGDVADLAVVALNIEKVMELDV